jgi:hypothetical protein
MHCKDIGEILGFHDHKWVEHKAGMKLLGLKRDQNMLKEAKVLLKTIDVKREKIEIIEKTEE